MFIFDVINILILLAFVVNGFLTLLVHVRSENNDANNIFKFVAISITMWCLSMFMYRSASYPDVVFWAKVLYFFPPFIPSLFYLFAIHFPNKSLNKKLLFLILSISTVLAITSFIKNWMIKDVEMVINGENIIVFGWAYYTFYTIHITTFFLLTFYEFFKKLKKADLVQKEQIKTMLVSLFIASFVATITNLFLLNFGIFKYNWAGQVLTFIWVGGVAYAIIKHKFLDVRLIVARSIMYLVLLFMFGVIYSGGVLLLTNNLAQYLSDSSALIIRTALALVMAFTFHPLRLRLEKLTNSFFFQSLPDEQEFLQSIGALVSKTLDIKSLASSLVRKFIKDFQLEKAVFLLKDEKDLKIVYQKGTNNSLEHSRLEDFSRYFKDNLDLVDELKNPKAKEYLRDHNYSIILKLVNKDQVLGYVLLGDKKSGAGFYGQELKLIELSAPSISVALTNAIQYAQIEAFSETLKAKVVEATGKLRNANKKLKDLDQRKDEFLSIAAHEMRAPLTAVKGYLSMVMDGDVGKLSKDIKQMLKGALVGADREIRLVNSMLNVSRIEENRMVYNVGEVHLAEVADNTFMEFKIQAQEKGLQFTLDIADKIKDKVKVDQDRIHEVVANFVSNAIKYTDKGQVIMRLYNSDKKTVRFTVSDSGYGMTKEEQTKLFQKFYRAESSAGKVLGTGLGLYTTKLLVEKFGGTIGLESKKGEGSTFWFELPVK